MNAVVLLALMRLTNVVEGFRLFCAVEYNLFSVWLQSTYTAVRISVLCLPPSRVVTMYGFKQSLERVVCLSAVWL